MSARDTDDHRLDHVVVLMFENRSFDNLLGYLYTPAEVPEFEGVGGRSWTNPLPEVSGLAGDAPVAVHPATSMATPYPDPGEEYLHINTQLFGVVAPESNRFADVRDMKPPFNAPSGGPAAAPPMNGFVGDYVGAFREQMGRLPTVKEYSQIMASFTPEQVPVLSGLARGFAVFDRWFCEVPSQTYPNRSFFHAGTSSGFVLNGPPGKFASRNDAPTIFEALERVGKTWKVYVDPAQILPATALIHARRLAPKFATNFRTHFDFYDDAARGLLPNYSFLEPNMFHPHTDMHPHSGARLAEDLRLPAPDTLRGGEQLLAQVYDSVRTSSTEPGSNWRNTLLLVTFDEHGGTFDHVPPPAAVAPDDSVREQGFPFDRLGVRIPTVAVSAWVDERSLISSTFQSTSVLRTLREWWGVSDPLTRRDASAPSLLPVLSRSAPRDPELWVRVAPRKPGILEKVEDAALREVEALTAPMGRLERDTLGEALVHEARTQGAPPPTEIDRISHPNAHEHFRRIGSEYFPGVISGRQH
ncbi:MAG TPA: alkaline phosphatase family protein [Thermoplasmata archaeon]|nr:alkaline phosphatase family protein [Thermoplasmata archaeon]